MDIKLSDKYTLRLLDLHQYYTYSGLLLGTPTADSNKNSMEYALTYAKKIMREESVYLIEPKQSYTTNGFLGNPHFIEDLQQHVKETYSATPQQGRSDEIMQRLPLVTCFGTFNAFARNDDEDFSEMTLVWYQDELAMPIDPMVVEEIGQLDWEALAGSYWI